MAHSPSAQRTQPRSTVLANDSARSGDDLSHPLASVAKHRQILPDNQGSGVLGSAISSIFPALASTACCWGPAMLSMFGAAAGTTASSSSSSSSLSSSSKTAATSSTTFLMTLSRRISRFRPYLLGMSATMITFSFYQVYGPPSRQAFLPTHQTPSTQPRAQACCSEQSTTLNQLQEQERHFRQRLTINRAVVWASFAVAVWGATHGRRRVSWPKHALPWLPEATAASGGRALPSTRVAHQKVFQVHGMSCNGCANKVTAALEGVPGVQEVKVDLDRAIVTLKGDKQNWNEDVIKNAIKKAGYEV